MLRVERTARSVQQNRLRRRWPWVVAVGSALAVAAGVPLAVANWAVIGPEDVYVVNAMIGVTVPFVGRSCSPADLATGSVGSCCPRPGSACRSSP